jgi:hypothetical protein
MATDLIIHNIIQKRLNLSIQVNLKASQKAEKDGSKLVKLFLCSRTIKQRQRRDMKIKLHIFKTSAMETSSSTSCFTPEERTPLLIH